MVIDSRPNSSTRSTFGDVGAVENRVANRLRAMLLPFARIDDYKLVEQMAQHERNPETRHIAETSVIDRYKQSADKDKRAKHSCAPAQVTGRNHRHQHRPIVSTSKRRRLNEHRRAANKPMLGSSLVFTSGNNGDRARGRTSRCDTTTRALQTTAPRLARETFVDVAVYFGKGTCNDTPLTAAYQLSLFAIQSNIDLYGTNFSEFCCNVPRSRKKEKIVKLVNYARAHVARNADRNQTNFVCFRTVGRSRARCREVRARRIRRQHSRFRSRCCCRRRSTGSDAAACLANCSAPPHPKASSV